MLNGSRKSMNRRTANLKISYFGEDYGFPRFFEYSEIRILAEGLPISVECEVTESATTWDLSKSCGKGAGISLLQNLGTGLGASAAKELSFIRAQFPHAHWRDQIDAAIQLSELRSGGWQDAIASAYEGIVVIVLKKKEWSVYPLRDLALVLHPYRRLYEIPVESPEHDVFVSMRYRESTCDEIQALTRRGIVALKEGDIAAFGRTVKQAWEIKKRWHPDMVNAEIALMEEVAVAAGAWGWKPCGTGGGSRYFLVLGDRECHGHISKHYTQFGME